MQSVATFASRRPWMHIGVFDGVVKRPRRDKVFALSVTT